MVTIAIPWFIVLGFAGFTVYALFKPPLRRWVAISIALAVGMYMFFQFFTTTETPAGEYFNEWFQRFNKWAIIISGLTVILAVGNLLKIHILKVKKLQPGWGYSFITLLALFTMSLFGILGIQFQKEGIPWYQWTFRWLWKTFNVALDSSMFALLAFFMASAAYRAFRARNMEASLMLATAIIVMLGRVPVGDYITSAFPTLTSWILMFPNLAAQRGIMMGVALGAIATSLKIILGIERPYLGGAK